MGTWGEGEEWGWGRGPSAEARGRGRQGGGGSGASSCAALTNLSHTNTNTRLSSSPSPSHLYCTLYTAIQPFVFHLFAFTSSCPFLLSSLLPGSLPALAEHSRSINDDHACGMRSGDKCCRNDALRSLIFPAQEATKRDPPAAAKEGCQEVGGGTPSECRSLSAAHARHSNEVIRVTSPTTEAFTFCTCYSSDGRRTPAIEGSGRARELRRPKGSRPVPAGVADTARGFLSAAEAEPDYRQRTQQPSFLLSRSQRGAPDDPSQQSQRHRRGLTSNLCSGDARTPSSSRHRRPATASLADDTDLGPDCMNSPRHSPLPSTAPRVFSDATSLSLLHLRTNTSPLFGCVCACQWLRCAQSRSIFSRRERMESHIC
ncbi:hypothetical protein C7M84_002709 [Penaeus vannamei]|uniref:Uncharacterized protein n=1 Tax=Penaeus vannamei TaxID=6689 RepID=A0A3R7QU89_PENVA|nr:hypothetical protein C7M84_002709 [Penaeus vannamei]